MAAVPKFLGPNADSNDVTRSSLIRSAIAIFSLVVVALLVPLPFGGRASTALGDLVHAPLFGALVFAALVAWQRFKAIKESADQVDTSWRSLMLRAAIAGTTLVLFGITMEFAQMQSGRSGSMHDVVANTLGILAGIMVYFAFQAWKRRNRALSGGLLTFALAVWGFAWSAPAALLADVIRMPNEFPLLASFESKTEMTRWYFRDNSIVRVHENVTDGEWAAQVHLTDRRFPAITLVDLVADWSEFRQLEIDVTLVNGHSSDLATGFVKLIDEPHQGRSGNRFIETFPLSAGQTTRIQVDLAELNDRYGGELDTAQMVFVDVGVSKEDTGATIRVDRMTLSKP